MAFVTGIDLWLVCVVDPTRRIFTVVGLGGHLNERVPG